MISEELQKVYDELRDIERNTPPVSFKLLEEVRDLHWQSIKEEEIDICCGIVTFTRPSIIMSSFDSFGTEREKYRNLFLEIYSNILRSKIHEKSSDFRYFLNSFESSLRDFQP
jgi:hypothetical protein